MQQATSIHNVDRSFTKLQATAMFNPVTVASADGAITARSGTVLITKAGVAVLTLAAPSTADNGKQLDIMATTANAHTVTNTTPGFNNAGNAKDVATFGGAVGDNMSVVAYNGVWYVKNVINVTFA